MVSAWNYFDRISDDKATSLQTIKALRGIATPSAHSSFLGSVYLVGLNSVCGKNWNQEGFPHQLTRRFPPSNDSLGKWKNFNVKFTLHSNIHLYKLIYMPSGSAWKTISISIIRLRLVKHSYSRKQPTCGLSPSNQVSSSKNRPRIVLTHGAVIGSSRFWRKTKPAPIYFISAGLFFFKYNFLISLFLFLR